MASLELIGAFALTEPDHGSDAVPSRRRPAASATATCSTGRKRWIGNAVFADLMVVWARDDEGDVGALRRREGHPGLRRHPHHREDRQARLLAGRHRAPRRPRPAPRTSSPAPRPSTTPRASSPPPAPASPGARSATPPAAYEAAVRHTPRSASSSARPLAGFQIIQYRLAKMLADVTCMRLICLRLAQLAPLGKRHPRHGVAGEDAQRRRAPRPSSRRRATCSAATGSSSRTRWAGTSATSRSSPPSRAPTSSTPSSSAARSRASAAFA